MKFHPNAPYFLGTMDSKRTGIHLCGWDTGSFYITSLSFVGNDKAIVCFENYPTEHLVLNGLVPHCWSNWKKSKRRRWQPLGGIWFHHKTEKGNIRKVPFPNSLIIP